MITEAQRVVRKTGLGGSDAAAVCGRHPHRTPLQVWMEKAWGSERPDTEYSRWGQLLEPVIAPVAAKSLGMQLTTPTETFRHPDHPWMIAHIDGKLDAREVLEVKCTANFDDIKQLGVEHTDGVLRHHLYQVQHYMEVLDLDCARVAYLIFGNKLRLYRVERDREFGQLLIEHEGRFWREHVEAKDAPDDTNDTALDEYIAQKYPKDDGSTLTIDSEGPALELVRELRDTRSLKKAITGRDATAEVAVKQMMGEAQKIVSPLGTITWKTNKLGVRSFNPRFVEETDE